jgi:hypothetical protein
VELRAQRQANAAATAPPIDVEIAGYSYIKPDEAKLAGLPRGMILDGSLRGPQEDTEGSKEISLSEWLMRIPGRMVLRIQDKVSGGYAEVEVPGRYPPKKA